MAGVYPVVLLADELVARGGTEMHLLWLSREMVRRGFPLEVWTFHLGEALAEEFRAAGVTTRSWSIQGVFRPDLPKTLARLRREVLRVSGGGRCVLQCYHTASDLLGAMLAPLVPGLVVISTRRDMGFTRKPIHDAAMRALGGGVSQTLVVSERVKWAVSAREGLDPRSITVIHNGVDLQRFRPPRSAQDHADREALRGAWGLGPEDVALLCVGNFHPIKGQGVLMAALPELRAKVPHARAVFVGGGKDHAHALGHAARLGLGDGAIFLGARKDIPEVLRAGDVFVLSSWSEGFSNAVIEAMASALPVVVTDVGGNREAVPPEAGSLVPVGDPGRLARALLPWCLDPARRRAGGEAARACVEARFGLDRMVDDYIEAQRKALELV
jgi:glycosyltransferase involved in cell wall biosynthesis